MIIHGDDKKLKKLIQKETLSRFDDAIALCSLGSSLAKNVPTDKTIGVVEAAGPEDVVQLLYETRVHHILSSASTRFLDEVNISARLIMSPDEFLEDPLKFVFPDSKAPHIHLEFNSYDQKEDVVRQVEAFIRSTPKSSTTLHDAVLIANELITNAVLDAPGGNENRARSEAVKIKSEKMSELFLSHDSNHLLIGCRDFFGSLDPAKVVTRLYRTYTLGVSRAINQGNGGAGIGLRLMLNLATTMYLVVAPGEQTIICCTLALGQNFRTKETLPKSFHIAEKSHGRLHTGGHQIMKINKAELNGMVTLKFDGPIDEDSVFPTVEPSSGMTLDLANVTLINSCGIREWVRWITPLSNLSELRIINAPKVIVDQMNMVDGFLPHNAMVESFFVPYYCDRCDELTMVLAESTVVQKDPQKALPKKMECGKCQSPAEMDVVEAKYFRFLGSHK